MTLPWSNPSQLLDEGERQVVKQQWGTLRIMWGAILVALAAYIIIANVMGEEPAVGTGTQPGDPWWLTNLPALVLAVISAVILTVAFLVRRSAGKPGSLLRRVSGSHLGAAIISWAMCESVGILGLVVFLITGKFLWLYVFVGVSAGFLVILRPRKRELIDQVVLSRQNKGF